MKFKFGLEKVLKVRKIGVDMAQVEFQEILSVYNAEKIKLENMRLLKVESEVKRTTIVETSSSGSNWTNDVDLLNNFILGQDQRIAQQIQRLSKIEKGVQIKREILLKSLSEAKMIEKLKDKSLIDFKRDLQKSESKEIDDIVGLRFQSRAGSNSEK